MSLYELIAYWSPKYEEHKKIVQRYFKDKHNNNQVKKVKYGK